MTDWTNEGILDSAKNGQAKWVPGDAEGETNLWLKPQPARYHVAFPEHVGRETNGPGQGLAGSHLRVWNLESGKQLGF